jgi:PTH1 family peptidyl-tRNA hydrolase
MKLIVGLGNIGLQYDKTLHNAGFCALDFFCKKHNIELNQKSSVGKFAKQLFGFNEVILPNGKKQNKKDEVVYFLKPGTFMNLSGDAVLHFVRKFKLDLKDVLIIFDDIDLPLGEIRFREKGSSGTHNGMRDIVNKLGSTEFPRLKIGIENRTPVEKTRLSLADFVLKKQSPEILEKLNEVYAEVAIKIEDWIKS